MIFRPASLYSQKQLVFQQENNQSLLFTFRIICLGQRFYLSFQYFLLQFPNKLRKFISNIFCLRRIVENVVKLNVLILILLWFLQQIFLSPDQLIFSFRNGGLYENFRLNIKYDEKNMYTTTLQYVYLPCSCLFIFINVVNDRIPSISIILQSLPHIQSTDMRRRFNS